MRQLTRSLSFNGAKVESTESCWPRGSSASATSLDASLAGVPSDSWASLGSGVRAEATHSRASGSGQAPTSRWVGSGACAPGSLPQNGHCPSPGSTSFIEALVCTMASCFKYGTVNSLHVWGSRCLETMGLSLRGASAGSSGLGVAPARGPLLEWPEGGSSSPEPVLDSETLLRALDDVGSSCGCCMRVTATVTIGIAWRLMPLLRSSSLRWQADNSAQASQHRCMAPWIRSAGSMPGTSSVMQLRHQSSKKCLIQTPSANASGLSCLFKLCGASRDQPDNAALKHTSVCTSAFIVRTRWPAVLVGRDTKALLPVRLSSKLGCHVAGVGVRVVSGVNDRVGDTTLHNGDNGRCLL
mmetsp:Transcript_135100/g.376371  ORF Transcript_135100/g.376371 Transcript_135100/m.376371 type:complete len:355 (+) Transcript_135100:426-1490(+)